MSDMNKLLSLEHRPEGLSRPSRRAAKLIAIEEHCATAIPVPAVSSTFNQFLPGYILGLRQRLGDVAYRIEIMDRNGIAAQIITLNQPGAQAFTNVDESIEYCKNVNQFIYDEYVARYPKRFFAFTVLPTQDGPAAAAELDRCVEEYGCVGAMINGFSDAPKNPSGGLYLDDPQFDVLWEVAERLDKPIFLHPRVPLKQNMKVLEDIPILLGAPYGFGRETVEHCLRLMYAGVFDRFPGLNIALGHMGEGLSWILPRTDSTFRLYTTEYRGKMKKSFCHYFEHNFICNTSGMPRTSALLQLMAETTTDRILFSVDYPYESVAELRNWFETVPISDENWRDMGYRNAIRLFRLPLNINELDGL